MTHFLDLIPGLPGSIICGKLDLLSLFRLARTSKSLSHWEELLEAHIDFAVENDHERDIYLEHLLNYAVEVLRYP